MTTPALDGLTQAPTPSSTPSGTTSPNVSTPAEFRYGNDQPEYLRGKTPQEAAALLNQTVSALQTLATQQQPYQPQQVQAPQPIDADNYVTGRDLQNQAGYYQNLAATQAQQYANPAIEMGASLALDRIKDKYPDAFGKYKQEIYAELVKVPKVNWTIDNLGKVVKFVLADHIDELADARAAQIAGDPALRSSGANGISTPAQPSPLPTDQLSAAQKATLERSGVSLKVVEEFCAKSGMPVSKWFERYAKSSVGDA